MLKQITILMGSILLCSCAWGTFSRQERLTIGKDPNAGMMRVLTIDAPDDSLFLRRAASPLTLNDVRSEYFATLCRRMLSTVTDPTQDGVGIAAPQVGVSRTLIAVQRFDREGEPFEFYVNPRISMMPDTIVTSDEGCLSVPGKKGTVMRAPLIGITYNDPETFEEKSETVEGFTAIIFQHEIDHLNGRLYIDGLIETAESVKLYP